MWQESDYSEIKLIAFVTRETLILIYLRNTEMLLKCFYSVECRGTSMLEISFWVSNIFIKRELHLSSPRTWHGKERWVLKPFNEINEKKVVLCDFMYSTWLKWFTYHLHVVRLYERTLNNKHNTSFAPQDPQMVLQLLTDARREGEPITDEAGSWRHCTNATSIASNDT